MRKIFILFLKYYLLHQVNALVHLLCHVTHVTTLNRCSDLLVTPAKIYNSLVYERERQSQICKKQLLSNIFYLNNNYQIGLLKIGCMVVKLFIYDNMFKIEKQILVFL